MEKISSNPANTQDGNIIVWLDFGPTAYINFGIASALSKIDKCNFIGIVSGKQDISFFSKSTNNSFSNIVILSRLLYREADF